MASSGKPKTTWAKLQREAALRERRLDKAARKQIRKQAQLDPSQAPLDPDQAIELDGEAPDSVPLTDEPERESGATL